MANKLIKGKVGVGKYKFSKPHLLIFAAAFALLGGGYLVYSSFAATTCSGPITITTGGTYTGCWESTSSTPVVSVNTSQPVTITNSTVRNLAGGDLIRTQYGVGADLTVDNVFAYGGDTNLTSGRFVEAEGNVKRLIVRNSTIENTRGIDVSLSEGVTILITRNRHHNIKGGQHGVEPVGNFVQLRVFRCGSCEISWNEVVNEYNKSYPEDTISIYHIANLRVSDNMLWHQSKPGNAYNTSSQGGITIDCSDRTGNNCDDNTVERNQIVDGYGILTYVNMGGSNNMVLNNRVVSDRYLPDGQIKGNGWGCPIGIIPGGSSNHSHNNYMSFTDRDGSQCTDGFDSTYPTFAAYSLRGAPEGGAAEAANNTFVRDPTSASEQAEWTLWQNKLTTNNITIGASNGTPTPPPPPPPPPAPTVSLSANPTSITSGSSSTLSWNSTNSTSCTASNAWTGSKATSGSQSVSPTSTSTYTLTCTGSGGSATANTTVTVNTVAPPPPPAAQSPYGGSPWAIPGTIEAENYDNGGEGVAYHDTTSGNAGAVYRSDNVDIHGNSDTSGYNVGYVDNGEWLEYTVNVPTAGTYTLEARVATINDGRNFHVEFGGVNKTGSLSVPNTGDWQTFQTITKSGISLSAGQQVMRVYFDTNQFNLNYIKLTAGTPTPPPPPPPGKRSDLNGDNTVNILDLSILLSKYNTSDAAADINDDGTVNVLDLSILLSDYGT